MSSADGSASPPLRRHLVKRFHAVPASEERYGLAEGPFWDGDRKRVLWVDINAGDGARRNPLRAARDPRDGAAPPRDGRCGGGLAGRASSWSPEHDACTSCLPRVPSAPAPSILPEHVASRLNDGGCDPAGRFLVGSLALDDRAYAEVLVRVDADGRSWCSTRISACPTAWRSRPTGDQLYSVDTMPGIVWVRDYDSATGAPVGVAKFLRLDGDKPDGLCVDDQGNLWIAMWGAGQVRCYSPSGEPTCGRRRGRAEHDQRRLRRGVPVTRC